MFLKNLASLMISLILAYIFIPKLLELIEDSPLVTKNYRGDDIANAMGLSFIFAQLLCLGLIQLVVGFGDGFTSLYLLGFVFIGFLGFIDDSIGNDKHKGFKSHIGAFFKGELTTGNIKASLGFFISFLICSFFSRSYLSLILNSLLLALFINLMNLFDLRPGRASKVFIILSTLMLLLSRSQVYDHIIYSLYGILLVYLPLDLNADLMMGDTGSNALGFTLGIYAMINFNITSKLILLVFLVILHILAEKYSFSEIIANNKILNYIDKLGR